MFKRGGKRKQVYLALLALLLTSTLLATFLAQETTLKAEWVKTWGGGKDEAAGSASF